MIETRLTCDSCKEKISGPFISWNEKAPVWVKNIEERKKMFVVPDEAPKDYCGINCFLKAVEIYMKEKRGILDIK